MKFLFDQNLSPSLIKKFADLFPGSKHVIDVGLDRADDNAVWGHALKHGFILVSKDSDFSDRVELSGYPPKIIWIRKENCSTKAIELILRENFLNIQQFEQDPDRGLLILF
ncbi:MAG: DUF5615 family PIN-like protein [Candidatus Omnitrophica bacterium]|nr:DUF5615 family PIN-like protein [Candidatus Omnitrophota bacterium]